MRKFLKVSLLASSIASFPLIAHTDAATAAEQVITAHKDLTPCEAMQIRLAEIHSELSELYYEIDNIMTKELPYTNICSEKWVFKRLQKRDRLIEQLLLEQKRLEDQLEGCDSEEDGLIAAT